MASALLALALGLPLALLLLWSVADGWAAPRLLPDRFTLVHWRQVLASGALLDAALLSTAIACAVTLLTAACALPMAWALRQLPGRARRLVDGLVLAPLILPGIVVAVGMGHAFLWVGLASPVLAVVLAHLVGTLPVAVRLFAAALDGLAPDAMAAARTLGAGPLRALWHVGLPAVRPTVWTVAALSFVGSLEEFDKSFIVGAPAVQTLPVLLYQFLDPYSLQFPLAAVVGLVLLVPVVAVVVVGAWRGPPAASPSGPRPGRRAAPDAAPARMETA